MASEVASAFVSLMPSAKGFGKATSATIGGELGGVGKEQGQKLGEETKKGFGSSIKGLGGLVAGALAGAAVGDFLKDSIGAASDLGEATSKNTVIFGEGAAQIQDFAATAAQSLGQSKLAVLDAAGTFGTFGKMAGLSGKELATFSTDFTALSSDLASFHNASPEEAVEAIGAALRGESEPIRRFGVLLDDATLRNEALKLGLIKTTKDALTPQQKVLAAQAAIMKQTKDAQGDFARTSTGLANKQRILAAEFANLKGKIGTAFLPAASAAVGAGLSLIKNAGRVKTAFKSASGFVQDHGTVLGIVAGIIATLFIPHLIALAVQSVKTATISAASWVKTQAKAVWAAMTHSLAILKMIAGWVLLGVQSTLHAAKVALAWTIGIIAPSVRALVSFGISVVTIVAGWVLMGVQAMAQAVRMAAAWVIAMGPVGWVIALVVGLALLIWKNWDKVKKWTAQAWTWVSEKVVGAWKWIKEKVISLASGVVNWIKSHWLLLLTILTGPFGLAVGLIIKYWDKIKSGVVSKATALIGWLKGLPGRITNAVGNLGSLLLDKGRDLIRGIWEGVKSMGGWLRDKLVGFVKDKIPGPIAKALGIASPSKVMRDQARWIPIGMALGIEDEARRVTNAAVGLANAAQPGMPSLSSQARAGSAHLLELRGSTAAAKAPQITVNDKSGDPVRTAKETARQFAFAGGH